MNEDELCPRGPPQLVREADASPGCLNDGNKFLQVEKVVLPGEQRVREELTQILASKEKRNSAPQGMRELASGDISV